MRAVRDRTLWRIAVDQSVAGETTIVAAEGNRVHCLVGFFLVPDGAGSFSIQSDTVPGGAGTETSHTGICKMLDGLAVGYRSELNSPFIVGNVGEALVVETTVSPVSGFFYGFSGRE